MQNDNLDRVDLCRMADDGCPNDTKTYDLSELWAALGNDDQGGR